MTSAAGSFGQFVFVPPVQEAVSAYGWGPTALGLALVTGLLAPVAALLARGAGTGAGAPSALSLRQAMGEAGAHSGFLLLTSAFFVCGFQVVFIAVHLPGFLSEHGLDAGAAADALAVIGLFNIAGTALAGVLGDRLRKKYVLAGIYFARAATAAGFLVVPVTPLSAIVIAAVLGLLWLGTVPLTSGLVAQIFGPAHVGALFGAVFVSHQLGSFFGAWLGGVLYDRTGSYDAAWVAVVLLGIVAGLMHLAIRDAPLRAAGAA